MALQILYEDAHVVVVDKPSGMLSVPGRRLENHHSAASWLQARYGEIHVVHRLDMDTSGLLIFARHKPALRHLARQFQQRSVHKRYIAVCSGCPETTCGLIQAPLRCDWDNRPRQIVDPQQGRPASTRWEKLACHANRAILALYPITGRAHQLRVHLQSIGHPILGDPFYHPEPNSAPRLLLHAQQLGFVHPHHGHWCQFSSPIPPEFGTVPA